MLARLRYLHFVATVPAVVYFERRITAAKNPSVS